MTIDEKKTKLKATGALKLTNDEKEKKASLSQNKTFVIGKILPPEIQKLKTKEKVAIIGFAPSWKEAPYSDETFDIIGINELYMQATNRRFTLWSEIHDPYSPSRNYTEHHEFLKTTKLPLFMQKHYDEFPSSIAFPRQEIKDWINSKFIINDVGGSFTEYTNQISWLLALTIAMGYKEIHVFGVDMAAASEYAFQRCSCNFFIGLAAGEGIKVLIPKTSELCKFPKDYGFETDNSSRNLTKQRITTIKNQINELDAQTLTLDFQREQIVKNFEAISNTTNAQTQQMSKDIAKIEITQNKNNEIIKLLETKDKPTFIKMLEEQNTKLTQILEQYNAKDKEIKEKLAIEARNNFINQKSYEHAKKQNLARIQSLQGALAECNYNLSNNIV
jgi:hypothetical protein